MRHRQLADQRGIVSFLVTMIMMIVITLIVIGFSAVARHNEREALDSQLGSQAYYAAESGVNAAQTFLNKELSATTAPPVSAYTVNGCKGTTDATTGNSLAVPGVISTATTGVNATAYTCVLINPNPGDLLAKPVGQTTSSVLHAQSTTPFTSMTFQWTPDTQSGAGDVCTATIGHYPTFSSQQPTNWGCDYGVLRVDMFRNSNLGGGAYSAANLANFTTSLYLQPSTTTSPNPTLTFGGPIKAYQATCLPSNGTCSVTWNLPGDSMDYYLRLSTIYQDAPSVTVCANGCTGTTKFVNGQVVIDSTGRAQDQLKRIEVRIPLAAASTTTAPAYAVISSGEICKDLHLLPSANYYDTGQCKNDQPGWPNVANTQY